MERRRCQRLNLSSVAASEGGGGQARYMGEVSKCLRLFATTTNITPALQHYLWLCLFKFILPHFEYTYEEGYFSHRGRVGTVWPTKATWLHIQEDDFPL